MGNQFLGSFASGMGGQQDPLAKLLLGQDPRLNPTGYNTPPISSPTAAASPVSQDIEGVDDIVVEGSNRNGGFNVTDAEIPDLPLKNAKVLEELLAAKEGNPQRKGMFGIKGTLRDILGTVGDAFLVQSGNKQVYAPQRAQERRADAMAGFTQDQMAAVERMAQEDPDTAIKLYEYVQSNAAKEQAAAAARQKATADNYKTGTEVLGRMFGAVNEKTYDRFKPLMQRGLDQYGLSEQIQLPDQYDADFFASLRQGGMPVNQQISTSQGAERIRQGDERIGIAQQNANANTKRAGRAPAGRAPARVSVKEQLAEKIAAGGLSSLTPSQREAAKGLGLIKEPSRGSQRTPLQRRGSATQGSSAPRAPTIKW